MARSKFRQFHLILEFCKSSFLYSPHPVYIGTCTFRKIARKLLENFGFFSSYFSSWEIWLSHEESTFIPVWHCLGTFLVVVELSWSPELDPGFAPSFCVWFPLVSTRDKLGISSCTPSWFLISMGQTRKTRIILVRSSFASLLRVLRSIQLPSLCGHCLCCFSCTQFHRIGLWPCWLWLSGIQRALPICALFATKSEAE